MHIDNVSACPSVPSVSLNLWGQLILGFFNMKEREREKGDKKNVFCDLQKDFPLEYGLIGKYVFLNNKFASIL